MAKPTRLNWCPSNDPATVMPPSNALAQQGYAPNQGMTSQNLNYYLRNFDQWNQWLDGQSAITNAAASLTNNLRMFAGGNWLYNNNVLSWDDSIYVAVPGVPDEQNQASPGNVTLGAGKLAYLELNLPFFTTGDLTNGGLNVANVAEVAGVSAGDLVTGSGVPDGTTVQSISGNTVTLTQAAQTTSTGVTLRFVSSGQLTVNVATSATFQGDASTLVIARDFGGYVLLGSNTGQMILHLHETRRFMEAGFGEFFGATAGEPLTFGEAVYISDGSDGRTAGRVYGCDASSANGAARTGFLGLAMGPTSQGSGLAVVASGIFAGGNSYTSGADYYLDPNVVGGITTTKPTDPSAYVVRIGVAYDSQHLLITKAQRGTQGGNVIRFTAGQNIGVGQFVYVSPGASDVSRTANAVYPADASASSGALRSSIAGIALAAATTGNGVDVLVSGRLSTFTGLTPGQPYYLDPTNVGYATATRPATVGQYVAPVGVALNATTLYVIAMGAASARAREFSASIAQNLVFASPASGGAGAPSFRALTTADVPNVSLPTAYLFGNGNDGAATVATGATLGPLTRDMYYSDLTIQGTGTVQTNGYKVFVSGTLDMSAVTGSAPVFQRNGNAGSASTTTTGGAGGAALAAGTLGGSTAGANGGNGSSGASAPGNTPVAGLVWNYVSNAGGNGARTGSGSTTVASGGIANTNVVPYAINRYVVDPPLGLLSGAYQPVLGGNGGAGGAGGSGSSSIGGGGGGGGGAGIISVAANNIVLSSSARANYFQAVGGAGGGQTGGGGGGGGGSGGVVMVTYNTLSGNNTSTSAINVTGGAGATDGTYASSSGCGGVGLSLNFRTGALSYVNGRNTFGTTIGGPLVAAPTTGCTL